MKQQYWRVVYTIISVVGILNYICVQVFRNYASDPKFGIQPASWYDFLDCIMYAPAYGLLRYIFESLSRDLLLRSLKINDPNNFEIKKSKVMKQAWSTFYYGTMSLVAFWWFADTDNLPTCYLGRAECNKLATSRKPVTPQLRFYFMMSMTHHAYGFFLFLIQSFQENIPEYNEFYLHHLITVFMISMSYLFSFFSVGATVLLVSEVSDFVLNGSKLLRDVFGKKIEMFTTSVFAILVVVWCYARVFVMIFCVLKGLLYTIYVAFVDDYSYFEWPSNHFLTLPTYLFCVQVKTFLIFLLCLLNLWWTYLLLSIMINRVFKKDTSYAIHSHGEKSKTR